MAVPTHDRQPGQHGAVSHHVVPSLGAAWQQQQCRNSPLAASSLDGSNGDSARRRKLVALASAAVDEHHFERSFKLPSWHY